MGRPLVQSPKSHPGIPKDLDLANTPAQFKRHLRSAIYVSCEYWIDLLFQLQIRNLFASPSDHHCR